MAKYTQTVSMSLNCPACNSESVIKQGKRNGYQRYLCKDCRKKFHDSGNTKGHRYPPEQIGAAVRMFYSGMSYKAIAEHMEDTFDIPEPSKRAIYEWVRDYTHEGVEEMADHKAHTSGHWVADEMMVWVGGEKYWNWNVMDADTRYILASYLSKNRDGRAATTVMRRAEAASAEPPKSIKTDKWRAYNRAIANVFPDAEHVQAEGLTAELNNNQSERLQGTFRQRTKTLRGLDHRESGQTYLDGWTLNYNLFRKHHSLGNRTPAAAAGLDAPFNEWEAVVEHAAPHPPVAVKIEVVDPKVDDGVAVSVRDDVATARPATPSASRKVVKVKSSVVAKRKAEVATANAQHPFLTKGEARRSGRSVKTTKPARRRKRSSKMFKSMAGR